MQSNQRVHVHQEQSVHELQEQLAAFQQLYQSQQRYSGSPVVDSAFDYEDASEQSFYNSKGAGGAMPLSPSAYRRSTPGTPQTPRASSLMNHGTPKGMFNSMAEAQNRGPLMSSYYAGQMHHNGYMTSSQLQPYPPQQQQMAASAGPTSDPMLVFALGEKLGALGRIERKTEAELSALNESVREQQVQTHAVSSELHQLRSSIGISDQAMSRLGSNVEAVGAALSAIQTKVSGFEQAVCHERELRASLSAETQKRLDAAVREKSELDAALRELTGEVKLLKSDTSTFRQSSRDANHGLSKLDTSVRQLDAASEIAANRLAHIEDKQNDLRNAIDQQIQRLEGRQSQQFASVGEQVRQQLQALRLELVSEVRKEVLQTSHSMYSHVANQTNHAVSEVHDAVRHGSTGGGVLGDIGTSVASVALQMFLPFVSIESIGRAIDFIARKPPPAPLDVPGIFSTSVFSLDDDRVGLDSSFDCIPSTTSVPPRLLETSTTRLLRFVMRRLWLLVFSTDFVARFISWRHPTVAHALHVRVGLHFMRLMGLTSGRFLFLRAVRILFEMIMLGQFAAMVVIRARALAAASRKRLEQVHDAVRNAPLQDKVAAGTLTTLVLVSVGVSYRHRQSIRHALSKGVKKLSNYWNPRILDYRLFAKVRALN